MHPFHRHITVHSCTQSFVDGTHDKTLQAGKSAKKLLIPRTHKSKQLGFKGVNEGYMFISSVAEAEGQTERKVHLTLQYSTSGLGIPHHT